uniref:Uncharacterized protein n=1 Tax=Trichuris muris TaxID=70415 RepID=A0A5S6QX40_TRIMR
MVLALPWADGWIARASAQLSRADCGIDAVKGMTQLMRRLHRSAGVGVLADPLTNLDGQRLCPKALLFERIKAFNELGQIREIIGLAKKMDNLKKDGKFEKVDNFKKVVNFKEMDNLKRVGNLKMMNNLKRWTTLKRGTTLKKADNLKKVDNFKDSASTSARSSSHD